mmetsp:Transcript_10715/g.32908  ORF Transcript_10715/g.32908 Transcript_10715/m.32908 type:complete len:246 (+) Transcript_10715:413-1150(+)
MSWCRWRAACRLAWAWCRSVGRQPSSVRCPKVCRRAAPMMAASRRAARWTPVSVVKCPPSVSACDKPSGRRSAPPSRSRVRAPRRSPRSRGSRTRRVLPSLAAAPLPTRVAPPPPAYPPACTRRRCATAATRAAPSTSPRTRPCCTPDPLRSRVACRPVAGLPPRCPWSCPPVANRVPPAAWIAGVSTPARRASRTCVASSVRSASPSHGGCYAAGVLTGDDQPRGVRRISLPGRVSVIDCAGSV